MISHIQLHNALKTQCFHRLYLLCKNLLASNQHLYFTYMYCTPHNGFLNYVE